MTKSPPASVVTSVGSEIAGGADATVFVSAADFFGGGGGELFGVVRDGEGVLEDVPSMPGVQRRSVDLIVDAAEAELGEVPVGIDIMVHQLPPGHLEAPQGGLVDRHEPEELGGIGRVVRLHLLGELVVALLGLLLDGDGLDMEANWALLISDQEARWQTLDQIAEIVAKGS